jgi:hypothetical protein
MIRAFLITAIFLVGTLIEEGPASTWSYAEPGLLGLVYGLGLYLNLPGLAGFFRVAPTASNSGVGASFWSLSRGCW